MTKKDVRLFIFRLLEFFLLMERNVFHGCSGLRVRRDDRVNEFDVRRDGRSFILLRVRWRRGNGSHKLYYLFGIHALHRIISSSRIIRMYGGGKVFCIFGAIHVAATSVRRGRGGYIGMHRRK